MDGTTNPLPTTSGELAGDLLRGAGAIAVFLFGSAGERRKVYHLAETSRLPTFHLGSLLCARKSVLLQWIAEQENHRTTTPRSASVAAVRTARVGSLG